MNNADFFAAEAEQFSGTDLKRILGRIGRYWYLLVLGSLVALCLAYLYLQYYAVPEYKVYSTLLIKDNSGGQIGASADALNELTSFKSVNSIDNEIEVLKSRSMMDRVVRELNLYTSFYQQGRIKNTELYGQQVPVRVVIGQLGATMPGKSVLLHLRPGNTFSLEEQPGTAATYIYGQAITRPYGSFTVVKADSLMAPAGELLLTFNNITQVADHYSQAVMVQTINQKANVLDISLTDPQPAKAKAIINKLVEVYNKETIEDKNQTVSNTLNFLDERLKMLTAELSGVEKSVEHYKSENGVTDIATQATDFTSQASTYNKQLSDWAIQIGVLESIERYLNSSASRNSTVPSSLGIKDETLLTLIANFNALQLERERMLRTIQPGSEMARNLDEQLASLRANILENLRNIKQGLQITSSKLRASFGQYESKIKRVPVLERELRSISRPEEIKRNLYTYLLQKREENALALAATTSDARVIDPALGGDLPVSPNSRAVYLMALVLGLVLPAAGIYATGLLNNRVQLQQDVVGATNAPVLGEITHNDQAETVVVRAGSRTPIAEMFRLLRANLNYLTRDKHNVVMLVTSSVSGEGKTFFSINLGASFSLTDKRVVLVDLDLRNPSVASDLGLGKTLGVTDYLASDTLTIADIICTSPNLPQLAVISAGQVSPNPSEMLMSAKFVHFMHELKDSFDCIILDTPPVGQVADAYVLNQFVDQTLYLVRYGYTLKTQLTVLKNIIRTKMLNNTTVVLNDAREFSGGSYAYGYSYEQSAAKPVK